MKFDVGDLYIMLQSSCDFMKISAVKGILYFKEGKVKCTLVQTLRLCTDRTALRESRGIALLFLDHGTRRG